MNLTEWGQYAKAYEMLHNALISGIVAAPEGHKVTKLGFWEDGNGNLRYIKAYDGELLLFTLEFSNASEAGSETWSIIRS
jgi:hypothetical protein